MSDKPNCYDCIHRGEVAGSAHSRCLHPALGKQDSNPFGALVQMVGGQFNNGARELGITGHPHGIRSGWFMWPANFDPTWLQSCNGFTAKEVAEAQK
jgi:hypothetical protein